MKTLINKWVWAVVAIIAVCLSACSEDNDMPPKPDPEPQENPEEWGDETPHVFYFDPNSINLHLNKNGFLMFAAKGEYIDHIVIDSAKIFPPDMSNEKGFAINNSSVEITYIRLKGKRATPFNNVDVYKRCCLQIIGRPDSKYNHFPELSHLPTINMESPHASEIVFDTVVYMDIITHTYFNHAHPAGSSMKMRSTNDIRTTVGMFYTVFDGLEYFKYLGKVGPYGGMYPQGLGKCNTKETTYPGASITLYCCGFPDKPGDYPMTIYMKFASGRTLSQDFKIRFVEKK